MTRTLIIAEVGVNHDGSVDKALELVDVAASAGADVVKFQTFDAEAIASAAAPQADYQRRGAGASSQLDMIRGLQLDREDHERLAARCAERRIEFLSTAFDERSFAWLLDVGLRRVKVPSGELNNGPLLLPFARSGLPLLVSTGMASLADVEMALSIVAFGMLDRSGIPEPAQLRDAYRRAIAEGLLRERVTLLHCTSSYPAEPDDVHLVAMDTLATAFDVPVGYSDHTLGTAIGLAAVARGARVLEKHITLDRSAPGPDHAASLEPDELAELVSGIRAVERALGRGVKYPTGAEEETIAVARRSVVAARSLRAGQRFRVDDLTALRPADGRPPNDLWSLVGRTASRDYVAGEQIDERD